MNTIYITGHRNPDLDSLCAANSYAALKTAVDPMNKYVPIHCSPVSETVRKQMQTFGLKVPTFKKDTYPRVKDVMIRPMTYVQADAPIYALIKTYNSNDPSVLPIYNGREFFGLLSIDDITAWFLRDNMSEEPVYNISVENVARVLPGKLIQPGDSKVITGTLLAGAGSYEAFSEYVEKEDTCIVFMGDRSGNIAYAMKRELPAIIITTCDDVPDVDFSQYHGLVYVTPLGTAEAIRRMRMAENISTMLSDKLVSVQADDLFYDAKKIFADSTARGMAVMDGQDFVGFVTRRCFLDTPSDNIILVDHNEANQSIDGIENANIVEIIDHHRLDALPTRLPIFIAAEPLGSTCTIVLQQFKKHGITPDEITAKTMLTGIIADTLILKSPTTTDTDRKAVEELAAMVGIEDVQAYGEQLFSIVDNLATQDPLEKSQSDFKKYESGGLKIGIGQCEVTSLNNLLDYADNYQNALEQIRAAHALDWTMLMITDVLKERSVLLVSDCKANRDLPFKQIGKYIYDMPGVMSRKKQLLPTILTITGAN